MPYWLIEFNDRQLKNYRKNLSAWNLTLIDGMYQTNR